MSKTHLNDDHSKYPYYTADDLQLVDSKQVFEMDKNENHKTIESKLRTAAIVASWISGIFSFATGIAAIVIGMNVQSQSLFGYGLDSVLDGLSSIVVLWRFYDSASSTKTDARERKACIVLALLFFTSAFSLVFKSTKAMINNRLVEEEVENGKFVTIVFSTCCGAIALVIATVKIYVGRRLQSRVLITDSIITYVGAAISFLGVLALELYVNDDDVWYLDAVFGLLCGVFIFLFGLKLLIQMTCLYKVKEIAQTDEEETP